MYHRNYTTYLQKELDFLKLLVSRFHEQENVNVLELDVALQKTQDVYEQLLRIKLIPETEASLSSMDDKTKTSPVQPPPVPPKKVPPPRPQPIERAAPEKTVVVQEVKKPQTEQAKSEILADKLSPSDFHPINETLAQQKTNSDLSSKLQTAPLNSISSGIGLNDKFLFIRELFKSDSVLFNNIIKHLDTASSLEEALELINSKFKWDENNETAKKFIHLIHRRHGNSG